MYVCTYSDDEIVVGHIEVHYFAGGALAFDALALNRSVLQVDRVCPGFHIVHWGTMYEC